MSGVLIMAFEMPHASLEYDRTTRKGYGYSRNAHQFHVPVVSGAYQGAV
jgi:hypothetical protein